MNVTNASTGLVPRIAMISTHGYVAAIPPLGAEDTGGQVVYVLELSRKLAQLGYAVDIWTRRFEGQPELEEVCENVRIIRIPCGGPEFIAKEYLAESLPQWADGALRYIRRHGLSYEFINSHYWDAGVAADLIAPALETPHVFTPHSLGKWKKEQMEVDYPGEKDSFELRYNFDERIRNEREIMQRCDLVVATTPLQLDMLTAGYGIDAWRLRMIPPGYDDTRFFPVGETSRQAIRNGLGFEGRVVLALGRLAPNKGYDLLIRGFAVVARRVDDVVLQLAVGGEELGESERTLLAELKALTIELGIDERVRFTGFIDDDQLADYYRAADLFVLSSRYEPFGMTAIEAMACGTPTVLTIHGGLWRAMTFGRHALFADPFDAEDLGITMLKSLTYERLRLRLSRMGAFRARGLFTWTGIAQSLISAVAMSGEGADEERDVWGEPWIAGE